MTTRSIFQAIKSSDNQLAKTLTEGFVQQIQSILDTENSSLLHIAANNNNYQIIQFLFERYDRLIQEDSNKYNELTKKKWINKKDNEGFTCLHYAVFRNNSKIAFLIQKHGGDIYSINTQGLTVLHIAAQGDSPLLMFYYLNKGLKISVTDSKGSTPLHWACYSGQQNSVNALLSWNAEIDVQDFTYGMTPLHLAVMSGNGRIVKKLLIRGCNRNIKNYNGKLPLDIANQNQYKNISQMILDKGGIQEFLNIKNPFRKIGKRTFPFYFFLFLFLSNYILNVSFVVSHHITTETQLGITFLSLGFLVIISFILVSLVDPGYLRPEQAKNYFQMLLKNPAHSICFDCKILKPPRSRHCQICDSCVKVYDHHCPWVGNCVGARNYKYFFMFLIIMEAFMFFTIPFEIINIQKIIWTDFTGLQVVRMICIFYGLLSAGFFILPLTFLIFVQIKNAITNQTTFERYGFNSKNRSSRTSQTSSVRSSLLKKRDSETISMDCQRELSGATHKFSSSSNQSYHSNCYSMCFGNANNITYQVAGF